MPTLAEAFFAPDRPLLVDEYLGHATELDVDAACDGEEVLRRGHHGTLWKRPASTPVIPPASSPLRTSRKRFSRMVEEQTRIIGLGLGIVGCYNIQFAIQDEALYVLEVNPRSSRTVPFVAKSSGLAACPHRRQRDHRPARSLQAGHPQARHRPCLRQGPRLPLHQAPRPRSRRQALK